MTRRTLCVLLALFAIIVACGTVFLKLRNQAPPSQVKALSLATQTGNLDIEIQAQNDQAATHWIPGHERFFVVTVANVGSTASTLVVSVSGRWSDTTLNEQLVSIRSARASLDEQQWEIHNIPARLGNSIQLHPQHDVGRNLALLPGQSVQLQLGLILDPEADSAYENQLFTIAVEIEGRQV